MKDPYFRWEREAAIHLLYPTLEGSMKTLEDYCGFGYPTTILIFQDGIVRWICREEEFYREGERLLELYMDPQAEKKMLVDWVKRIEAHYGQPMDIEWAIDGQDKIWILQSRPITTL